ncbi:MAG: hypothetical protein IJQ02_11495 [Oscillospiraceae bacterium]|nr:hypothetical protein [Oscillospiraceae bacterium]
MEIICNVCRKRAEIEEPKIRTEGDLEIQYVGCPSCGQEYIVSVTDAELRGGVEKYIKRLQAIKTGKMNPHFYRETERLHKENTRRCRELIQVYLGLE